MEDTDARWRDFHGAWRSRAGFLVLTFASLSGVLGALALVADRQRWSLLSVVAFFLAVVWLLGRQMWSPQPVLRVGPQGLSGFWLQRHVVPWSDVADLRAESIQGHLQLVVHLRPGAASLAPTARWLGSRKPERRIPLMALEAGEPQRAIDAAQRAFSSHAGVQASKALEDDLEEHAVQVEFAAQLRAATPLPWALYLMVALNVGVWGANALAGMNMLAPSSADLFRWGANSTWAVTRDGQYWRLLTAAFLHGGLVHLALNMLGLWSAGLLVNRLYGNRQFLLIYLGSALCGSALSLHFSAQRAVAVGASGAVFGVLGALVVALFQHRHRLPAATRKRLLATQTVFIAYALVEGFARSGIDNAAHVGGLLGGALLAALLVERLDDRATPARRARRVVLAGAVLASGVGVLVASAGAPPINHALSFSVQARVQRALASLPATEGELQKDVQARQAGRLSEAQLVSALRERHLPAYRTVRDALAPLALPATDPGQSALADVQRLTRLLVEVMELEVRKADNGGQDADLDRRLHAANDELKAVGDRIKARAPRKPPSP